MNNERSPRREVALGRRVCPPREPAEDPGGWRRGARGVPSASLPLPAPSRPPPWRGLLLSSRSPPWRPHGAGRRAGAQETPVESNAPRADQRLLGARRAGCHGAAFLGAVQTDVPGDAGGRASLRADRLFADGTGVDGLTRGSAKEPREKRRPTRPTHVSQEAGKGPGAPDPARLAARVLAAAPARIGGQAVPPGRKRRHRRGVRRHGIPPRGPGAGTAAGSGRGQSRDRCRPKQVPVRRTHAHTRAHTRSHDAHTHAHTRSHDTHTHAHTRAHTCAHDMHTRTRAHTQAHT